MTDLVTRYRSTMSLVTWAHETAEQTLASALPRRWRHVRGVARKAQSLAAAFGDDAPLLEAAAVLHDVGYAPDLALTGFHPLDGARYLRSVGAPHRLVCLVARHSCAIREARLRGLDRDLAAFIDEGSPVRDALWFCDLTTTPDGEPTSFADRVSEIRSRYGPESLVTAFITEAEEDLRDSVARTQRLAAGFDLQST